MSTEADIEKLRISMFGKVKDCAHCDDLNTFYNKTEFTVPKEYSNVDLDSDAGKEWAKTNTSEDIPASKICTISKEGKEDCRTVVGVDEAKEYVKKYIKASDENNAHRT